MEILKTLCDLKLCDCIVRKILLTINFARLKFVRNLIMQSGNDSHKALKKYHAYIYSTMVYVTIISFVSFPDVKYCSSIQTVSAEGVYHWPEITAGAVTALPCMFGADTSQGEARRLCNVSGGHTLRQQECNTGICS